jgi:hypothetical protein
LPLLSVFLFRHLQDEYGLLPQFLILIIKGVKAMAQPSSFLDYKNTKNHHKVSTDAFAFK